MNSDFYRSLWKAAAGRTELGKEPIFWRYFQDNGFVAFQEYGENDLRRYQNKEELNEALNQKRRYIQS